MLVMNVIAEILKKEGVSTLFCFPTTPIIEAAAAVGIKPVICRQERVGVHMADGFARAMAHLDKAATKELDGAGIDPKIRELIRLRASQLNGCAYCVDMHTKDARAIGETEQRLYALPVWRETPLPGAVLTRVASSHIRVGTFQFFAVRRDTDAIRRLADHVITRHYPDLLTAERPYHALLAGVVARQADLVARWLAGALDV